MSTPLLSGIAVALLALGASPIGHAEEPAQVPDASQEAVVEPDPRFFLGDGSEPSTVSEMELRALSRVQTPEQIALLSGCAVSSVSLVDGTGRTVAVAMTRPGARELMSSAWLGALSASNGSCPVFTPSA